MRPIDPVLHANVGSAISETRFRLDAASTAHIVGLLTNQYSDQVLAFIRELSTNAADSHISARILRPIEVRLPTSFAPEFSVEDFGLGLSIDELEGLYSAYGASSKRDDDDVNGTLGIGSKAPLAYGDTFNVQARKGGVQVLAVVTKDTDGVPVLRVLDTSATSEPDGVKVTVPVRQRDFHEVRNTVEEFYSYWPKGSVLVDGKQPTSIRDQADLIWIDDDVAVSLSHYESRIVQHNVAYPVTGYTALPKARSKGYSVIAFVPTGTVNFPPSREALEYTERTNEVLALLDDYVVEAFTRVIRDRVAAAPSTYERLRLVNTWRRYVPEIVQDFFGKQGLTIKPGRHGFGWRLRRGTASKVEYLQAGDIIGEWPIIIGYDLKTLTPKAKAKAKVFFEDAHNEHLFLPSGTNLAVAEGRGEIYTWAEIEAAVPDAEVKKATGTYKGQTEYGFYLGGRRQVLTLTAAKKAIAEAGATIVAYATADGGSLASRLPDVAIFAIESRSIGRIERETGAVDAWGIVAERLAAAKEALTPEDRFTARLQCTTSEYDCLYDVIDRIEDPEFADYVRRTRTKNPTLSVTLQAYINLGGRFGDVEGGEDIAATLDGRYPLVASLGQYYVRRNIDEIVFYINAKYNSITNTEAPASPTLRKDQS